MKLADAMRDAMRNQDTRAAGRIADFCRFRLGWKHRQTLTEWARVSGSEPADVDALLYESDNDNDNEP